MTNLSRKDTKLARKTRANKREVELTKALLKSGLILPDIDSEAFSTLYRELAASQSPKYQNALRLVMRRIAKIQQTANKGPQRIKTSTQVFDKVGKNKNCRVMLKAVRYIPHSANK